MTIVKAAKMVIDEARDGISYIAFWKDGRGWKAEAFWAEDEEDGCPKKFDERDAARLREIARADRGAILVNSYYHNLGAGDNGLSVKALASGLKRQYMAAVFLLSAAV